MVQKNKQISTLDEQEIAERKQAVQFVDAQFQVKETVEHLQAMMKGVTKDELTPDTVNAACNCVQNLNLTIKTAIQAAKFIKNQR